MVGEYRQLNKSENKTHGYEIKCPDGESCKKVQDDFYFHKFCITDDFQSCREVPEEMIKELKMIKN